jgi:FAD/FMN-containing dehydrogenase
VLEPASVDDIVRLIDFAGRHGISVAARGQGHAAFGQSQVRGGVVIDMARLARVHSVGRMSVDVDAGVTWRALLDKTLSRGLVPPTLTDYQDLSVGGTLCVGGIDGAAFRFGAQVDNVFALDVVTGAGHRVRCSRTRSPRLFDAVLAGRGQCGVITRAVLRLIAAAPAVRPSRVLRPMCAVASHPRGRVRPGRT